MAGEDEDRIEDLTSKVFRMVVENGKNGKNGVLQSELWKELDLTSRDGSRIAIRLEKRSLITRERILENGRWTYKLIAIRLPVDTTCIEQAPCLTCPVEHMCSTDGIVSPNTCVLIENWTLDDMLNNGQSGNNSSSSNNANNVVDDIGNNETSKKYALSRSQA